ncbi:ATP-binding protein [Streptomyces inhibens]|nr:ATP-binding protein [Streptomyces inhibens]
MPSFIEAIHDALTYSSATLQALGLQSFPGGDLSSAGAARRYVRTTARWWGVAPDQVEALESIAGELAGNALEHSNSRLIAVVLSRTARTASISVTDEGQGCASAPARPGPEQECGRGLLIVEVLADRWGQRKLSAGFTVWAEIAIEGRARDRERPVAAALRQAARGDEGGP